MLLLSPQSLNFVLAVYLLVIPFKIEKREMRVRIVAMLILRISTLFHLLLTSMNYLCGKDLLTQSERYIAKHVFFSPPSEFLFFYSTYILTTLRKYKESKISAITSF